MDMHVLLTHNVTQNIMTLWATSFTTVLTKTFTATKRRKSQAIFVFQMWQFSAALVKTIMAMTPFA